MKIPEIFKRPLVLQLLKPFVMVQFGPPRSGSTLVFNLMREIFPRRKILKVHSFRRMCRVLPVVATYRHPFDSIASSLLRYGIETPTDADLEKQMEMFNKSGIRDLPMVKEMPNVLSLRYEDFVNDFDHVFDRFETHFDITILESERVRLKEKYGIENVEKMIEDMKTFADHDSESQLHGRHISKYKGASCYYKEFFSGSQIERLNSEYSGLLDALGY